jgi:hypothetical protein
MFYSRRPVIILLSRNMFLMVRARAQNGEKQWQIQKLNTTDVTYRET